MEKKFMELQQIGINVENVNKEKEYANILSKNIWVRKGDERPNFQELSSFYLARMERYVSTLRERACMEKWIYQKLISDLLVLRKKGYRVQRKIAYSYLNENKGFVFVEPYQPNSISDEDFIRDAFAILFGNGLPAYYVEFDCHNLITEDLQSQLRVSEKNCAFRLKESLIIHGGLSADKVIQIIDDCLAEADKQPMVVKKEEMALSMQNFYETVLEQQRLTMD